MADPTPPSQPEATPPSQTYFGVIFDLNGQILPVSNQDVKSEVQDFKKNGIDFKMPTLTGHTDLASSTRIGTIQGGLDGVNDFLTKTFGSDIKIPDDAKNLPAPLDTIATYIEKATWYVQKFEVHIKGSDANDKTQFSVAMSAIFESEITLVGSLKVQGFFFSFSNKKQS